MRLSFPFQVTIGSYLHMSPGALSSMPAVRTFSLFAGLLSSLTSFCRSAALCPMLGLGHKRQEVRGQRSHQYYICGEKTVEK